jgi:cellulose synthase operon protein C
VRISTGFRLFLSLTLIAAAFTACSGDPNLRKQKYLQSGQRYFEKGKYREAAIEFTNALKLDQDYADAHYRLAQSYLKLQRWSSAYQELARTVELEPENYPARIDMVKLLIATGNFQPAQEQTDLLLQQRPNDPQVHFAAASLLAAEAKYPAAIEEMQKAIALDRSDSNLYLNLAMMLMKNNQPAEAEENFKKAVELDPKGTNASMMLGAYYQSRSQYAEAEHEFRRAIGVDPKNLDALAALARLYLAEGNKIKAEEFLGQVKRDFPDSSVGYRMLGDFYFTTGDMDKAIAEYAALYQEHPKDLAVKKNYIHLLMLKGRREEAHRLNQEILETTPDDNEALLYRGQLELSAGDVNGAASTLQTVIKNDPDNAAAHHQLGLAFQKLGNLANAESELQNAVRLRPDLVEAQRALALLAMRQGDMSTLEQAATQIINTEPASPEGYALRAVSYINRNKFAAADEDIRKAIAADPQSQLGYVQRGNLKFVQKQYSEAGQAYQKALDRDPKSTDALRGLMNTYLAQNQMEKALAIAKAQIAKAPSNSGFYDLLGTVLLRNKKDLNGAESAFRRSLELDKSNSDATIKLGQAQVAKGDIDQAIATYQQAIKEHFNAPEFYTLLGELYESERDWTKAQDAYQKALGLKPNDPLASNNLANVLLQGNGNLDIALSLAQTARRGMPDSPDAADTLGWVYYQKGVYGSAVSLFQEALKLQEKNKTPDSPDIHYHLALAYEKTNQPQLARQHFERVLKIDPGYSEAAEIRKQLTSLKS